MFKLRPYQQAAVDAAIKHMSTCFDSGLVEAATGAGKSLIIAEIAQWLQNKTGKKVLCLAPSKELVEQNAEKYRAYGLGASIFSASAGAKCMRHNVVFGSPMTVLNSLHKFGEQFCAVIIDEAHGTTPTIKEVVHKMRVANPKLRVLGLTATPYRLGSGYIYGVDMENNLVEETNEPFFGKLIYQILAGELVKQGYLTPPTTELTLNEYDTNNLQLATTGNFTADSVEEAFEGHGRLTADIVYEVVSASRNREGVMFFAATVQHAEEVLASLPADNAALITGKTKKSERVSIIERFKARQIKYLVNVSVLTTGFDAPHVDVVAILRATESASLLQQIIGRGLRLADDKYDCLVMDFAGNIERHGLEDDLFKPVITVAGGGDKSGSVDAECEDCGHVNQFAARKNPEQFTINKQGYFVDLAGDKIMESGKPLPAHFGRRCQSFSVVGGQLTQCNNRWSSKECPECDHDNDIAARYCKACKAELIDPNEKLALDFKRIKKDPRQATSDKVIRWQVERSVSQKGNETLRVTYTTEFRTFPVWYTPSSTFRQAKEAWRSLSQAVFGEGRIAPNVASFVATLKKGGCMPGTITVKKEGDFYKVTGHNEPESIYHENT